jgi:tetratricopeptide (TPR) repeat protein
MDQGRTEEAFAHARLEPDEFWKLWSLAILHSASGQTEDSDKAMRRLTEEFAAGNEYQLAEAYSMRGEVDSAFEWLQSAIEGRDPGVTHTKANPRFRLLHDDPRWADFLKKIGFRL